MQKLLSAKIFSLLLAGFILLRGLIHFEGEAQPAGILALVLAVLLVMIWFAERFAERLLPLGRMAGFAADATQAGSQVVAAIAWIILLLLLLAVILLGKTEEPALVGYLNSPFVIINPETSGLQAVQ